MPLYQIQDSDRPMFVIAKDWQEAIVKWQNIIEIENGPSFPNEQPDGIILICSDYDIIK